VPSASAVPPLPYAPRHETRPGSPPRPCHCRRAAARSWAEATSWRTYPTAGTPGPGTMASAPAGRASPTRTRPGRPTATQPAPGDRPPTRRNQSAQRNRPTREHQTSPGCHSPASRQASANKRCSGLQRPAWAGWTAAWQSSVPATGPTSGPREADPFHPPGPPRRAPLTGPHAGIRCCRRAARVRRRRSCRPRRPGEPCPSRCRRRKLPLSRPPACRSAKRRRLPYRRTRHRRSRPEPAGLAACSVPAGAVP